MTKSFAIEFIRWWCHQEEGNFASHIAEEFVYDDGLQIVSREEFLVMRAGSGLMNDIKFIEIWCNSNAGAVMFEVTDTVTDLRHRTCWMITCDGDRVMRVVTCSGNVLKPEVKLI